MKIKRNVIMTGMSYGFNPTKRDVGIVDIEGLGIKAVGLELPLADMHSLDDVFQKMKRPTIRITLEIVDSEVSSL